MTGASATADARRNFHDVHLRGVPPAEQTQDIAAHRFRRHHDPVCAVDAPGHEPAEGEAPVQRVVNPGVGEEGQVVDRQHLPDRRSPEGGEERQ